MDDTVLVSYVILSSLLNQIIFKYFILDNKLIDINPYSV